MKAIRISDRAQPLKLEWLRTFLAVVDQGGFTRAARVIRLSQPAVSTQVKELERCLKTRLFDPAGGRLRLTQEGRIAAQEARRLLELAYEIPAAVSEAGRAVKGVLQLGASTTPANYLLPDLMAEFERNHPDARTTLQIGNSAQVIDLLHSNEVDLGIVGIKPDGSEFVSRPVFEDEIVPFVSSRHLLAREKRITLDDLLRQRLVLREASSATRRLFDRWMGNRDLAPDVMELG